MVERPQFSVVIPYCDRLPYIERVLRALGDQDIGLAHYEIVIGCLEYSPALLEILRLLPSELRIRCVMTRLPWNVSRARNIALTQAGGEVLLLLDSDMLLPRSFLRTLRDRYDLVRKHTAVIAQMLNYSAETDVELGRLGGYEYYRDTYLAKNCRDGLGVDARWTYQRRIPWSLCWTASIAVSRTVLEEHSLYFDESFTGWGAEDIEWGYRLQRHGVALVFADDLWAIHLPHKRDAGRNFAEQERNYDRLLCKWPCFDVEMVTRFGAVANQRFDALVAAWDAVRGAGQLVNVVEFSVGTARNLALGAISDATGRLVNAAEIPDITAATVISKLPLLGLRLPFEIQSIDRAYLLPSLRTVPDFARNLILSESQRISNSTVIL